MSPISSLVSCLSFQFVYDVLNLDRKNLSTLSFMAHVCLNSHADSSCHRHIHANVSFDHFHFLRFEMELSVGNSGRIM